MSAEQKFLFDNAFEAPLLSDDKPKAPPPPPEPEVVEPEISEEDLERARAEGRQEGIDQGREEGRAEAFSGIEQTTQTLLLNLTGRFGELLSEQPKMQVKIAEDSLIAASMILRKIVPSLEKSAAIKEIESVVSECLQRAQDEPRLVVRVSETMLEPVKSRIDTLAKAEGFEGKIVFLATDELGDSDVRVEWADGGAERRTEDIWRDIDQILGRFLNVPPESLSRLSSASTAPVQVPSPAPAGAAEPAIDEQREPDPDSPQPPLVSPMAQMGLAASEETAESQPAAVSSTEPATGTPDNTGDDSLTIEKPAAVAAAPQEPNND